MDEPQEPKQPGRFRWSRLLLAVSLALNLLVFGAVAGAFLRHDREARTAPLQDLGFGPFGAALSNAERDRLSERLSGRSEDLRANREEIRQDFAAMLRALRAEPFAPADLRAALDRQRDRLAERQAIGQAVLLERIEAMDVEERRAFADRMERRLKRFGHRPR